MIIADAGRSLVTAAAKGSGSAGPFFVIFAVLFIAIALVQIVRPQLLWRTRRWAYRNPQANEPSRAGYTMQRISGVIMVCVGVFILLKGTHVV